MVVIGVNTMFRSVCCPECNGRGFNTIYSENSIGTKICEKCQGSAMISVPMTNGEIIRILSNEELHKVLYTLRDSAIYSGGVHNRLLLTSENPEDLLLWLNKEADDIDMRTIFPFIDKSYPLPINCYHERKETELSCE